MVAVVQDIIVRLKMVADDFIEVQQMSNKSFAQVNAALKNSKGAFAKHTSSTAKFSAKLRMATRGLAGFRMEMLSVAFGGQMLQGAMMGLLGPAMEATGVFEVLSSFLEMFFLPAAFLVLDAVMWFMDLFLSLPEPVQNVINIIVIIVAVLGTLLAVIGFVVLFVGGLISAFGTVVAVIFYIIAAVVAVIAAFFLWKLIEFLIGLLVKWFQFWWEVIKKAWEIIKDVFSWIWTNAMKVKDALVENIGKIWEWLQTLPGKALDAIKDVINWIKEHVPGAEKVFNAVGKAIEFIGDVIEKVKSGISWAVDKIKDIFGGGKNSLNVDSVSNTSSPASSAASNTLNLRLQNSSGQTMDSTRAKMGSSAEAVLNYTR